MLLFKEPTIFKNILEPYTSIFLGEYFNTGLLIIFGLIFALILYLIPKKFKFRAVLAASIVFVLISSTIANFVLFLLIIVVLFLCSNYDFKFRNVIFWITEAFMLLSTMIIYRIFSYHALFYALAAYYTMFRSIHYYIDIKQGSLQKVKFIDYLSYLLYFPAFAHGPIDRIGNLYPNDVKRQNLIFGFKRIFYGLAKYAFLLYVLSYIEEIPFSFGNFWQWLFLTAYGGAIKLYVLLSGNIDIVIGVSSLMGFKVSENFPKLPFVQKNLTKFWLNWQATIVNWLIAYVYYPLCKNRKRVYLKTVFIIMIIQWLHLFYNFKDFPSIEIVVYYTLGGIFLGGTLAISKIIEKKKTDSKQILHEKYPAIAKIIYADNMFSRALRAFVTFNIITIGLLSPLYILLNQLR